MRCLTFVILLSLCLYQGKWCCAQTLPFINYNIENGLPQSTVYSLYQDRLGYLWAGTQGGICRFDGKQFQVWDSQQGLIDNHVTAISEDADGNVWMGHRSGALSFIKNNKVYSFHNTRFINNRKINHIYQIKNMLFVATQGNGLYIISLAGTSHVTTHIKRGQVMPSDTINQVFLTKDKKVMLATSQGLAGFQFVKDKVTDLQPVEFPKTNIKSVFQSRDNTIWCATNAGLIQLKSSDGKNNKTFNITDGLLSNEINDVKEDQSGNLWVATNMGISRISKYGVTSYSKNHGLLSDIVNGVLVDEEGSVWFNQDDGISQFRESGFELYNEKDGLVYNEVYAILKNKDDYWIGTAKGISIFRPSAKPENLFKTLTEMDRLPSKVVRTLFKDNRGNIWIGTQYGAARYDPSTGVLRHFNSVTGLKGNKVSGINQDRKEKVWFATLDSGVAAYDYRSDKIKSYTIQDGLASNSFWTVHRDKANQLWFGSADQGLMKLDTETNSLQVVNGQEKLISHDFGSITSDSKNNIWIASIGGGVFRYNGSGFIQYGTRQGLSSNNPYFVFSDKTDLLWLGTNTGIEQFDPVTLKVTRYEKSDGFTGIETNQNAIFQDETGMLWIGTVNGLMKFNFQHLSKPKPPKIYIDQVRLFLQDTLPIQKRELAYDENYLSFDYSGISLAHAKDIVYRYKLDGFDQNWSPLLKETFVTYTNLSPGTYTFTVMAGIENQSISSPATYTFVIRPPFWQTWWFVLLLLTVAGSLTYLLYQIQNRKYLEAKMLNYFATSLYGRNTIQDVCWDIARNCSIELKFEDCVIYWLDQKRKVLVQMAAYGPKNPEGYEIQNAIEIPVGKGIVGSVAQIGKAEIIKDTAKDQRYITDDMPRRSEISVPIFMDGEVVGVIDSEHSKKAYYKKWHLHVLTKVAEICSAKVAKTAIEENLRTKISMDLHDDIGSALSSIHINSQIALHETDAMAISKQLVKISSLAKEMITSISDIVWAIHPENDYLNELWLRMKDFTTEILEPLGIAYTFDEPENMMDIRLDLVQRKNLYLIFKEALNNAVKHSGCTAINIRLTMEEDMMRIEISDNGNGIKVDGNKAGNGLKNMEKRAAEMNAGYVFSSVPGEGTYVHISIRSH